MFNNSITATNVYRNEVKRLQTELRSNYLSILQDDMQELKVAFPNLDVIYITGTTPEWNDGEECLHSSDTYIDGNSSFNGLGELFERMYDCYDLSDQEELDANVPTDLHHVNKKLSKEELDKVHAILRSAKVEDNLETVFGTDWMIFIDFRSGTAKVTKDDYECGY